jgi:hypothetical protein
MGLSTPPWWWPRVVLVGLCLTWIGLLPPAGAQDVSRVLAMVNRNCTNFAILGPCYCNQYTPCVIVSYWEPAWMVETVKITGSTSLDNVVPALSDILGTVGSAFPLGGGGAGVSPGTGRQICTLTKPM